MEELVKATEKNWKEVIDLYLGFMEALVGFQAAAPDIPPELFGPELELVYQRGLHRQKPVYVLEHLEWEHVQKGDLSHLRPREPDQDPTPSEGEPEQGQVEQSEEPPLEPEGGKTKGKQSDSPEKEPEAAKVG